MRLEGFISCAMRGGTACLRAVTLRRNGALGCLFIYPTLSHYIFIYTICYHRLRPHWALRHQPLCARNKTSDHKTTHGEQRENAPHVGPPRRRRRPPESPSPGGQLGSAPGPAPPQLSLSGHHGSHPRFTPLPWCREGAEGGGVRWRAPMK